MASQATERQDTLSDRQRVILDAIEEYIQEKGYAPAVRDIMDATGITSIGTMSHHLDRLELKGYIERDETVARSIRVVRRPRKEEAEDIG